MGPPTLHLQLLLNAAKVAFDDDSLDLDDVEGMCVSLMDQVSLRHESNIVHRIRLTLFYVRLQGYIKAYILHSKRLLVLQKGDTWGFPPIAKVNP